jgi:stalled ribosome rescue protein Dom34
MPALVIWIDSKEAKVLKLTAGGIQTIPIQSHGPKHHAQAHGKHGTHAEENKFYHEVAETLGHDDSSEWLITGPGLAREHFKAHLESHHPGLAKRVVGVTKSDHPSPAELLKDAKKFFRHFELYQA